MRAVKNLIYYRPRAFTRLYYHCDYYVSLIVSLIDKNAMLLALGCMMTTRSDTQSRIARSLNNNASNWRTTDTIQRRTWRMWIIFFASSSSSPPCMNVFSSYSLQFIIVRLRYFKLIFEKSFYFLVRKCALTSLAVRVGSCIGRRVTAAATNNKSKETQWGKE